MTLTKKEREVLKDYLSSFMKSMEDRLRNGDLKDLSETSLHQLDQDVDLLIDIYKRLLSTKTKNV